MYMDLLLRLRQSTPAFDISLLVISGPSWQPLRLTMRHSVLQINASEVPRYVLLLRLALASFYLSLSIAICQSSVISCVEVS